MGKRNRDHTEETPSEPQPARRLKRLAVSPEAVVEVFRNGSRPSGLKVENGVPRDAKVVGHEHDHDLDRHWIILEDNSFDEIAEGQEIPTLTPKVSAVERTETPKPLAAGSVVQLNSGGPKMTVARITSGVAMCYFFGGADDPVAHKDEFAVECLKVAD